MQKTKKILQLIALNGKWKADTACEVERRVWGIKTKCALHYKSKQNIKCVKWQGIGLPAG